MFIDKIFTYEDMMGSIKSKLAKAKSLLNFEINDQLFFDILFEMNKTFDKQFVETIHLKSICINSNQRNHLRKYFYYGVENYLNASAVKSFPTYKATMTDKEEVLETFMDKCSSYDSNKIISSIHSRYKLITTQQNNNNSNKWLRYYDKKRAQHSDFSLFVLDYCQDDFIKDNYDIKNILHIIANMYDHLENYRHFVFKLNGALFNKNNEDVTWQIVYKVGIYCENFVQYKKEFFPFKKQKQIDQLASFLQTKLKSKQALEIAEDFYSCISSGFKFEDCYVSNNQNNILLIYQKIQLDSSPIPCPACMSTKQGGNSYPEMFLKSYECKNPSCPERSKSGRGKRFDEYSTFRYFKLVNNHPYDQVSDDLYSSWRRDVFSSTNDIFKMLCYFYSWHNETVCISKPTITTSQKHHRRIKLYTPYNETKYNDDYNALPIVKLFNKVNTLYKTTAGQEYIKDDILIVHGDSTKGVSKLLPDQIGAAITSPPYYNAREYSQWSNLILYLIDMFISCRTIYDKLVDSAFYLYNIGDIVSSDNIYVESNMSKKRLQLGFLSCLIFESAGYNLVGNIIWDKGEVQSKRNSTPNHNSGYVKCINCYEHVLVFKKGREQRVISDVKQISPVIKINSKGENTYNHTAPYPISLVDLIMPFVKKELHVLDPFVGSGTTLVWCKQNNIKGIGFELNDTYYSLAQNKIKNHGGKT